MIRLIIADDHFHVRQAWCWVLRQFAEADVVAQCINGKEVVESALRLDPDLILMNVHLDPVNGIEATRSIRAVNGIIKIIGVSEYADRSLVREMLAFGANGFVTKNSSSSEMISAIHAVMAGNTYLCEEIRHFRNQPDNWFLEEKIGLR